jgi:hypothetical protein
MQCAVTKPTRTKSLRQLRRSSRPFLIVLRISHRIACPLAFPGTLFGELDAVRTLLPVRIP